MDLDGYIRAQIREHHAAVEDAIMRSAIAAFREGMCAELLITEHSAFDVAGDRVTRIHRCSHSAHHLGGHDYPTVRLLD